MCRTRLVGGWKFLVSAPARTATWYAGLQRRAVHKAGAGSLRAAKLGSSTGQQRWREAKSADTRGKKAQTPSPAGSPLARRLGVRRCQRHRAGLVLDEGVLLQTKQRGARSSSTKKAHASTRSEQRLQPRPPTWWMPGTCSATSGLAAMLVAESLTQIFCINVGPSSALLVAG